MTRDRGPGLGEGLALIARGARLEPVAFAWAMAGGLVFALGVTAGGWVLARVVDRVVVPAYQAGGASAGQVAAAAGALAGVALVTAAGVVLRRIAAYTVMYRLQARHRDAVADKLLRLPMSWHRRHPAGELLSVSNSDAEAAFGVFAPLPFAVGGLAIIAGGGVLMVLADPVLAAAALAAVPLLFLGNVVYLRAMSTRVAAAQQARAEVSGIAHESVEGAVTVKALGLEAREGARFVSATQRLRAANVAVGRARAVFEPAVEQLPALAGLAVVVLGAWRVDRGAAGVGDVVQVAYLLTVLAFPVRGLGWVLAEMPRSVVGWRRVSAVLEAGGETASGTARLAPSPPGAAAVRAVGVSVDLTDAAGEPHRVLHGVDLEAVPGRAVAVVGPTGSGKSTLAAALVRLLDPAEGRVEVDGHDVRDLAAGELAGAVGYVPQDVFVFDDTVRDNVALGRRLPGDDPDEAVWDALRLARLDEAVRALPDGLDTRVGERGTTLSGGQRQRLAIARAVVTRPRALVLDDATSALDATVEAEVLSALRERWPTTLVVVAYRRSTVRLADSVVHLVAGRVVGTGTHDELLRDDPAYRELVAAYDHVDDLAEDTAEDPAGTEGLEGVVRGAGGGRELAAARP